MNIKRTCPVCSSPERYGVVRVETYVPFECETAARPRGTTAEGEVIWDTRSIMIADTCVQNVRIQREVDQLLSSVSEVENEA